jgi:hypothetical protein
MKTPNQIDRKRETVQITAADILKFGSEEPITEQGEAAELFDRITTCDQFVEFLTLPGYERPD